MRLFRRAKGERNAPQLDVRASEPKSPPAPPPPPPRGDASRGPSAEPGSKALSPASLSLLREVRARGGSENSVDLTDERGLDLELVKDLQARGLVESSTDGRVLKCPRCLSISVRALFACPQCGSKKVNKGTLHVHQSCGGYFTEPRVEGGRPRCPVCGAELREGGYGIVGAWFECESCGRGFEEPKVVFTCTSCSLDFDIQSSKYDKVVSVKLSSRGKELLRAYDLLETIQKAASEEGYQTSIFAKLRGASGIEHEFDAVLDKEGRKVAVSLLQRGDAEDVQRTYQRVAELLAKSYDLPKDVELLLIAEGRRLDQSVRRPLEHSDVKLVEGGESEEGVAEEVRKYLRARASKGGESRQ